MPQLFENEFIRQGISFENEFRSAVPSGPEGAMDVPAILRKVMDVTGLKQAPLSKKIGVSQGTISKWINKGHSPKLDEWERLMTFASSFPKLRDVVSGGYVSGGVRVMGYIGAGAEISPEIEQVPPEGLAFVEVPIEVPAGLVALQVRGDSMLPAYRDGDVVLVFEEQRRRPEHFDGREAAVRTTDGKRFIKEVHGGSRKGLFNLLSHNASPIKDVRLEWIGEIFIVVKGDQVRKMKRKAA